MNFDNLDCLAEDVLVVGGTHYEPALKSFYAAILEADARGALLDDIGIRLKREPDNPYDSYAVQVIGKWIAPDGRKKSGAVGYLPKKVAFLVGVNIDEDDKIFGEFISISPHEEHLFDLRINVFVRYAF